MIVKGTSAQIAEVVKAISPTWPTALINSLDPGEWHFILNGVDTLVIIEEAHDGNTQV